MAQYASVDVGSNAVRFLVGEVSGTGVLSRVRFERRFTRLAEGLHERRRLSGPAMRRALTALKLYSNIIASYNDGICAVRAVGTHALREAGNSGEFVRSVKAESGLTVEVIGTEEEAGLMALGAVSSFDVKGGALVLDIGGGSTEWALLAGGAGGSGGAGGARGRISGTSSVPLGVIGLVQRHIKSDPPSEG